MIVQFCFQLGLYQNHKHHNKHLFVGSIKKVEFGFRDEYIYIYIYIRIHLPLRNFLNLRENMPNSFSTA